MKFTFFFEKVTRMFKEYHIDTCTRWHQIAQLQVLTICISVTFFCFVCADLPLNGSFFQVVHMELIVDVA